MNAPMLWIVFPLACAALLFFLRRWRRLTAWGGAAVALALGLAAAWLPIGESIRLGPVSFTLEAPMTIFGRQLILEPQDSGVLLFTYLLAAFWLVGGMAAGAGALFAPLGLAITGLLAAARAVEPFLYAALFIELVVLLCVPLLSAPGQPVNRGALRFLAFQTFGLPFILFTGHLLEAAAASPTDETLAARAGALLGMGFVFLLGIFPFHSWMPMLAESAHPYRAAFIFSLLPAMIALLGLGFLDQFAWLRDTPLVYELLRVSAELMIVAGGVSAAFQRHLGRMLGYAVMVETGFALLAIRPQSDLTLHFALLLPRAAALGSWALALAILQQRAGGLSFRAVQGLARSLPLAGAAIILAHLSLAGLPLLASFPARLALWDAVSTPAPAALFFSLLGCVGLFTGALRSLAVLVMGETDAPWQMSESRGARLLLVPAVLALFLLGLFPHWFLPLARSLGEAFTRLGP